MDYLATVSTQYRLSNPESQFELSLKYAKREAIESLIDEINENASKYDPIANQLKANSPLR